MNRPDKREQGAALVELAIVLPFLIFLMLGALDTGIAFSQDTTLTKSVRDASRYISQNWNLDGCYTQSGAESILLNFNNMFSSTYSDYTLSTDNRITIEQICLEDAPADPANPQISGTPNVILQTKTNNGGSTNYSGNGTLAYDGACGDDPDNFYSCPAGYSLHIRTTATFARKSLFPNLKIGNWSLNMAPKLGAVSIMRALRAIE